ncbi:DUF6336 family protein [Streptomyces massasporeus]
MTLDQDGVMLPRLRPAEVARRGVTFGLLNVVPLAAVTLTITDHSDPGDLLSAVSAAGLSGAISLVTGAGFWWADAGDIRHMRDYRTITGHSDSVTIVGPVFLRRRLRPLVLEAATAGLYQLTDAAP